MVTTPDLIKASVADLKTWLNHLSNAQGVDLRRAVAQDMIAIELLSGLRLVVENVLDVSLNHYETDNLSVRQADAVTLSVAALHKIATHARQRIERKAGPTA